MQNPSVCSHSARKENIDFGVSGEHHGVVKTSRKLPSSRTRRRSRVILIEKHFSTICNKITLTIRPATNRIRWFVKWAMWSCLSYGNQVLTCNAQNAIFIGIKELSVALVDISSKKVNPAEVFINGDWMPSQSRAYVIKKGRLRGARHGKTETREEHFIVHSARRRSLKKNFDGIHDHFQRHSEYRDPQRKIGWTWEVHREGQISTGETFLLPIVLGVFQVKEILVYHTEQNRQKCTDETPFRLPNSTYKYAPSPPWIWKRETWTNSSLTLPKVAFFFFQYFIEAEECK